MTENNQKNNNKGRPNNANMAVVIQEPREQDPQQVKQYWTQHRITLIAYQVQYVRDTKPEQVETTKQKMSRKKNSLQYESGFLLAHIESLKPVDIDKKIKQFDQLQNLRNSTNQDDIELYQFIKIMLDLKHESIVIQFMQLYNLIVKEVNQLKFQYVREEQSREKWLEEATKKILTIIKSQNQQKYPYLNSQLDRFALEAQRLIKVQIYCLMAQKFNFNINEYYSEAFNVTLLVKCNKKIKSEQLHHNFEQS